MITVISPAKSLDFESKLATPKHSQPLFLEQSKALIEQLRHLQPQDIASLMKLSDKLATLNFDRFQNFSTPFSPTNARAAVLAFQGDVYQGMDAASFSTADFNFAQKHLRILSGLYGVLRPLDLIQPYRLEMGTRFKNNAGTNLYQFWADQLNQQIQSEVDQQKQKVLINLASNEYFKAVKAKQLSCRIITPQFKDFKNGQYKMISFFAKKARGYMSRYIIQNKIENPEALKAFDLEGYYYDPKSSSENDWVFLRDEAAK
jgi:uncharacterized protein